MGKGIPLSLPLSVAQGGTGNTTGDISGRAIVENSAGAAGSIAKALSLKAAIDVNGVNNNITSLSGLTSLSCSGTASFGGTLSIASNAYLTGTTSNTIYYGTVGTGLPGTATGTKISLYGTAGTPATSDYAIGINTNDLWLNAPTGAVITTKIAGTVVATFGATIIFAKPIRFSTAAVAAAGTTQATATGLANDITIVTSGTGGVRLSTNIGQRQEVFNRSGAPIKVYPGTSAQIESAGVNNPITLGNGAYAVFEASTATQVYWPNSGPIIDGSGVRVTLTTAGYTVPTNTSLVRFIQASVIASATITLSTALTDGHAIQFVNYTGAITALTFSPAVVGWNNGDTLPAPTGIRIRWDSVAAAWYREQ